mmetsp:Transcript_2152/g.6734  ORF Transcript_2152/g.6734 Transcript_2152/m.6734 type:complete len:137 (-) Transcript_2152:1100-1510(-)
MVWDTSSTQEPRHDCCAPTSCTGHADLSAASVGPGARGEPILSNSAGATIHSLRSTSAGRMAQDCAFCCGATQGIGAPTCADPLVCGAEVNEFECFKRGGLGVSMSRNFEPLLRWYRPCCCADVSSLLLLRDSAPC